MKRPFICDGFNLICVVICDICKEEYIGETGEGKTKLRERAKMYCQHIWQPHCQQFKVEGHLGIYFHSEFRIFSSLQIHTNLRQSYETRKFKTKLRSL